MEHIFETLFLPCEEIMFDIVLIPMIELSRIVFYHFCFLFSRDQQVLNQGVHHVAEINEVIIRDAGTNG